jgi:hypothetical protein
MVLFASDLSIDGIEISLNAVGKASKLKVGKIKVKKRHTFQNVITFVRNQLEKGQALKPDQSLVSEAGAHSFIVPVH